jgi:hypothetical protein
MKSMKEQVAPLEVENKLLLKKPDGTAREIIPVALFPEGSMP